MASLPTPTIVRIKRRLGSESSETIIVSAKRKCLDCDENDAKNPIPEMCTAILKKLTTLKQDDLLEVEAQKALEKKPKHSWDFKEHYKMGFSSLAKDLIHKKSKSDVTAIRFKLVCAKRNIEESRSENSNFHMFDALNEKEENALVPIASCSSRDTDIISCNGVPMESEKVEFVYDLYYTSLSLDLPDWVNNICEIQKYEALDYRDEGSKTAEMLEDDSDDENSESNWRNDYPEEDDAQYFNDEDEYLCDQLRKKANFEDGESYDESEFDESGDFDEEGGLVVFKKPQGVFKPCKRRNEVSSDESDSDSEYRGRLNDSDNL